MRPSTSTNWTSVRMAACTRNGELLLWDVMTTASDRASKVLQGNERWVNCVRLSPDSRWLVHGDNLWDLSAGDATAPRPLHREHWYSPESIFSPDSRWLVSYCSDRIQLLDLKAPQPRLHVLQDQGEKSGGDRAAVSPDSRWLITWIEGYADPSLTFWDLTSADPIRAFYVWSPGEYVDPDVRFFQVVDFSPDGRWLITGGQRSVPKLWDLTTHDPSKASLKVPCLEIEIEELDEVRTVLMGISDA